MLTSPITLVVREGNAARLAFSHHELNINITFVLACEEKKVGVNMQIYGYRMSLWHEHFGSICNRFKHPKTLRCVKYVNSIAEKNWNQFIDNKFCELEGHILKYPVKVNSNGQVMPIGYGTFPDVNGWVLGAQPSYILSRVGAHMKSSPMPGTVDPEWTRSNLSLNTFICSVILALVFEAMLPTRMNQLIVYILCTHYVIIDLIFHFIHNICM